MIVATLAGCGGGADSGADSVVMTCNEFNKTTDLYATYMSEDVDAAIEFCLTCGKGLPATTCS